jgi:hypothetical protein
LGPNDGGADVREVDKCRRWDYAAAGAVTCMLTRALATWSKLSSGMVNASAWSASMLLLVGGKETFGGWSTCLLAHENVTTLAFFTNEERSERLSTTPSPAGGGLYKDSCPTALFLLENIASTCSTTFICSALSLNSINSRCTFHCAPHHHHQHIHTPLVLLLY